jgi:uncharacterized protein YbjQ (UPF0145 family)
MKSKEYIKREKRKIRKSFKEFFKDATSVGANLILGVFVR